MSAPHYELTKRDKVLLTDDEREEVFRRAREGRSAHDDGLFRRLVAAHGYGPFDCHLYYTGQGPGEDAFLLCLPRSGSRQSS